MSTSDMTEYLRVKMAERGTQGPERFMQDGFDRWAESTQPARMGQMEKMPSEPSMESMGGAMTVKMAKKYLKDKMGSELQGGFDPVAAFNDIKNGATQLLNFWRAISKFLNDLKSELNDEVINNPTMRADVKAAAQQFLTFLQRLELVQAVLDGISKMASAVGFGRRGGKLQGGSVMDDFRTYGKTIFDTYMWIKKNGPAIRVLLGLNAMKPVGTEVLKVVEPVLNFLGAGKSGGRRTILRDKLMSAEVPMLEDMSASGGAMCTCPKKVGGRKKLPVVDATARSMSMGGRKCGGIREMSMPIDTKNRLQISEDMYNQKMASRPVQVGMGSGGRVIGGKAPSARGAVVSKIMKEKGLSLPQASKYVKEHGLY